MPSVSGNLSIGPAGWEPIAIAVDPIAGIAFIGIYPTYLTVVSLTTDTILKTVDLGANASPNQIAFDGATRVAYVATGANQVVAVSEDNLSVVARISVGVLPDGIAYDPANGCIYTTNFRSGNLSVISTSNNTVIHTFGVLPFPTAISYDPVTNQLIVMGLYGYSPWSWVAAVSPENYSPAWEWEPALPQEAGSYGPFLEATDLRTGDLYFSWITSAGVPSVLVLNGTNGSQRASIPVGASTSGNQGVYGLTYDSSDDLLYVANPNADRLTVVSTSNNSVVATVPSRVEPEEVAYDQANRLVYATNAGSQALEKVNASAHQVLGYLTLAAAPLAIAYANESGRLFAVGADRLDELSTQMRNLTAFTQTGLAPQGVAYDPRTGDVFVASSTEGTLEVYSSVDLGLVATISVGQVPIGVTFDNVTDLVYVSCYGSNQVTAVWANNLTVAARVQVGVAPVATAADDVDGELFVANLGDSTVSVISMSSETVIATIPLATFAWPVDLAFDSQAREMFVTDRGTSQVTVISTTTRTAIANVSVGEEPFGIAYDPNTDELLVTDHAENTVWVVDASSRTVVGHVTVGWFPIAAVYAADTGRIYIANSASGNVSILSYGTFYSATFAATGLPLSSEWAVSLGGRTENATAGQPIVFSEPNGTYSFTVSSPGYQPSPGSGKVTIDGTPASVTVTFTQVTYGMMWTESGLPAGTNWSVMLNGITESSVTPTISFAAPNGTYAWTIANVPGWHISAGTYGGRSTVNGVSVVIATTFTQVAYTVTFTENGLPSGTSWSVTMAGTTHSSTSGLMSFTEPNGTYSFSVIGVSGFTAVPSLGNITVPGAPTGQSLVFSAVGGGSSSGFLGLPGSTGYYLVGGIAILVVVGLAAALILRTRRR